MYELDKLKLFKNNSLSSKFFSESFSPFFSSSSVSAKRAVPQSLLGNGNRQGADMEHIKSSATKGKATIRVT